MTTWNPADNSDATLSGGNLTAAFQTTSAWRGIRATTFKNTGKWHFEDTVQAFSPLYWIIGIANSTASLLSYPGADLDSLSYQGDGHIAHGGGFDVTVTSSIGDVIAIEVDIDLGRFWVKNATTNSSWFGTAAGDPATSTNGAYIGDISGILTTGIAIIGGGLFNSSTASIHTLNPGPTGFVAAISSGFSAWDAAGSATVVAADRQLNISVIRRVANTLAGTVFVSPGTIAPDGTVIDGGTADTLTTVHGTWSFGSVFAQTPGWGIGPYCRVLLNGKPVSPRTIFYSSAQRLMVNYGGNVYSLMFDQLWNAWGYHYWIGNDGNGAFTGPTPTPIWPLAIPTMPWAGPYTPSPDGTTISGGTGTVRTRDGDWTFGPAGSGGWNLFLNGIETIIYPISQFVTEMRVHSNGNLFFRSVDASWHVWVGMQANASALGAIGLPIPIGMTFSPTLSDMIPVSSPVGTFVTAVTVEMSNGSAFTGSLSVGLDWGSIASASATGMNVVTALTPVVAGVFPVTATQNGSTYTAAFNMQTSA